MATPTAVKTNTKNPKRIDAPKSTPSKISKEDWVKIIGILGFIDISQWILDVLGLVVIGEIINRVVDIVVALGLLCYLWFKGELDDPASRTRTFAAVAVAFLGEAIPILGTVAPLWVGDGFYLRHQSIKRNQKHEAERKKYLEDKQRQLNAIEIRQKIDAFKAKRAENDIIQDNENAY